MHAKYWHRASEDRHGCPLHALLGFTLRDALPCSRYAGEGRQDATWVQRRSQVIQGKGASTLPCLPATSWQARWELNPELVLRGKQGGRAWHTRNLYRKE